jgi:hypothetical protein
MVYLQRGALVEYGTDLLGPLKNVVIFQFNPESLSRTIDVPRPHMTSESQEINQSGLPSLERISFTAYFSAADQLDKQDPLAQTVGIGPQLAALEKMVHPGGQIAALAAEAIDYIENLISDNAPNPTQPIPRDQYPRILFIWGRTRVLPVTIESMTITEQQYDHMLNPIQAQVSIELQVTVVDKCSDDNVAKGAQTWSNLAKESQAIANLANTANQIGDLIPFT